MCATNFGIVLKKYMTAAYSKLPINIVCTSVLATESNTLNNHTKSQPSISASQILLGPARPTLRPNSYIKTVIDSYFKTNLGYIRFNRQSFIMYFFLVGGRILQL